MRPSLLHPSLEKENGNKPSFFTVFQSSKPVSMKETPLPDREFLIKLATALQTSLDPLELIRIFAEHFASKMPFEYAAYDGEAHQIQLSIGVIAEHSCKYTLITDSEHLGTLEFQRSTPFSNLETQVIESTVANLVYPLRNALRYQVALHASLKDPLTGASNRASLDSILDREIELARRHAGALSIIMLDLDRFKRTNDRFGHVIGDRVLVHLVGCIKAAIRDSDILFRYGGEEFVVVLSNTDLPGAALLAERVRNAIEEKLLDTDKGPLQSTASLGIAMFRHDDDAVSLLQRADAAMYQSKLAGRNQVSVERPAAAS